MFTKKRLLLLRELSELFKEEYHYFVGITEEEILKTEKQEENKVKLVRKINKKEE